MATFALIDVLKPVHNGSVTIATGGVPIQYARGSDIADPSTMPQMVRLEAAYKIAGSTSWERPGGPITP